MGSITRKVGQRGEYHTVFHASRNGPCEQSYQLPRITANNSQQLMGDVLLKHNIEVKMFRTITRNASP